MDKTEKKQYNWDIHRLKIKKKLKEMNFEALKKLRLRWREA